MVATKILSKKKLLVPSIRFEGFQELWVNKPAADLFTNSRKKGDDSLPIYSVTLDRGMVPRNSLERQMGNDAKSADNLFVEKNDISYNMMRMWQGAYGLAPEHCMVSPAYVVLHPRNNISSEFFIRYFNRSRSLYLFTAFSYGLTSDRLRLYYKDFARIKFTIPDFEEQQKIAAFLSAIDEKIQQLTRKKNLLEQYKKGVMQQLFSGKLRFKDENGNAFPKWQEKLLGEISEKNSTKNRGNKVNFVLTNSATQGIVSQDEYFDREIANQNNLEGYYIVAVDDFVYNPRISVHAPVGPIKRNKLKKGVMSPLYSIFRFREKNLKYFEYYFETEGWHTYLESVSNMGARHDRMNIANNDFFKMPIPFPCLKERNKVTDFLDGLSLKIKLTDKALNQTQTFKKGLLQQMFV